MEPKPFQKPYPRLWFGGSAEAAVRRGVGLCDGFFGAGSSATSAFASQVAVVRETLARLPGVPPGSGRASSRSRSGSTSGSTPPTARGRASG